MLSINTFPFFKFLIFFLDKEIFSPSFNSLIFLEIFLNFTFFENFSFSFFFEDLLKFSANKSHKILSSSDKTILLILFFFYCSDFVTTSFQFGFVDFRSLENVQ